MTPVTHIRIDYADGSADEIELLPDSNTNIPLYGWTRTCPDSQGRPGAYTAPAIAALLFQTALARHITEYDFKDPKTRDLLQNHAKP